MTVNELIQQYGMWAVLIAFFAYTRIVVYRERSTTNNRLDTQRLEMEKAASDQRLEMERSASKQRYEQDSANERARASLEERLVKGYEARLLDSSTRIRQLEAQQKDDARDNTKIRSEMKEVQTQLEKLRAELNEQNIQLLTEKRHNIELQDRNEDLQLSNNTLVRREQEMIATNQLLRTENDELQKRLASLEQRIADMETDGVHKNLQIEDLLAKVMNLEVNPSPVVTGEFNAVPEPA